ncbi:nucleotidyltransferase domain-containing protein [Clostridium perfringens]
MYGIHESVYSKLINYFEEKDYIEKVILFGSRAKGNYKYNSDIDLAILCDKLYKGTVVEEIEELIGVYSSDIVFLDQLTGDIKKQVDVYGIEIYNNK